MEMQKSKDREKKGKSSLSVDSNSIMEKVEKIGEELLKKKNFTDQLTKLLRKQLKSDEKLERKQTNPVTGIKDCILDDDKNIDLDKAKLSNPFIRPKMTLTERKSIIENMRKENQKKFATMYSSDRNSPVRDE
jgi:hypothetical protein